ncbi:MAG: discoidin domain-containing protein, partial [Defluviitaleaceae bacterium]|nr:discoidin domain-containing protein [Defluviitaleaceae bacterium]
MKGKTAKLTARPFAFILTLALLMGIVTPVTRLPVKAEQEPAVSVLLTGVPYANPNAENPAQAFSGQRWNSQANWEQSYIGMDMGAGNLHKLTQVRVQTSGWEADHSQALIQGSLDGVNYETLGTIPWLTGLSGWLEFNLSEDLPAYRFFKLHGNGWSNQGLLYFGLEFYGYAAACVVCESLPCVCPCGDCGICGCEECFADGRCNECGCTDCFPGGKCGVCEICSPNDGRKIILGKLFANPDARDPSIAFNGDIYTEWSANVGGGSFAGYIGMDMGPGNLYKLAQVRVYVPDAWQADHTSSAIQGSLDGENYVDLGYVPQFTGYAKEQWHDIDLPVDQAYRFFRLQGNSGWSGLIYRELQFVGIMMPCDVCEAAPCICPCEICNLYPCMCAEVYWFIDFDTHGEGRDSASAWGGNPVLHTGDDADAVYGNYLTLTGDFMKFYSNFPWLCADASKPYELTITYRTNEAASSRIVAAGFVPGGQWYDYWPDRDYNSEIYPEVAYLPVTGEWETVSLVFYGGQNFRIVLRQTEGEASWDIADITVKEYKGPMHNVVFDATGGSVTPASVIIVDGFEITLPNARRTMSRFLGWFTEPSPGEYIAVGETYGTRIGGAGDIYLPT